MVFLPESFYEFVLKQPVEKQAEFVPLFEAAGDAQKNMLTTLVSKGWVITGVVAARGGSKMAISLSGYEKSAWLMPDGTLRRPDSLNPKVNAARVQPEELL